MDVPFTAYLLPNDEKESERLDIYHHMMGIVNGGKLHLAPLDTGASENIGHWYWDRRVGY